MPRSHSALLTRVGAIAGTAALAGLMVSEVVDRLRLRDDPEYAELSRPLEGRRQAVVSADGTRLHAEVSGSEAAPTVVLAHGWTCALRFWHPQIVELSRDLRIVAYDQRGHGESGDGAFTTDALADDLGAVLAACVPQGQPALLVGHSMGAMSIVAWAHRHPGEIARAAGAMLVSTGIGDLVAESTLLPIPPTLVRARRLVAAGLIGKPPMPPWLAPVSRRAIRYVTLGSGASAGQTAFCHDVVVGCRPETWGGWGRVLVDLDLGHAVASLRTPTLVMVGDRDRLTPPAHARRLERALPQPAGLVVVPGAGHMLPVEAADEVNTRIRDLARRSMGAAAQEP